MRPTGTRAWARRLALLPALLLAEGAPLHGQAPDDGDPRCPPCRVALRRVATLDGSGSPAGYVPLPSTVVRGPRYHYLVSPLEASEIQVYGRDGRFRGTIGREGEGPGEYRMIAAVEVAGDSTVRVFDRGNQRLTVLDRDHEVVLTRPLPAEVFENGALVLPGGQVWMNAFAPDGTGAGQPLHLLDDADGIARSIGGDDGADRITDPQTQLARASAPARGEGFWTVRLTEYVLERWDADGDLVRRITRSPRWFAPVAAEGDRRPPRPVVLDVDEDAEGRVWIVGRTADPSWRKAVDDRGVIADFDRYGDTVVEVIDPRRNQLLARARLPHFLARFAGNGTLFTYEEDAGSGRVDLWRVRLVEHRDDR